MPAYPLELPHLQTLSLLGSYVPRRCGIATFTKDLRDALDEEMTPNAVQVVAMDDTPEGYDYPPEVRFQIPAHHQATYRTAADVLNINQVDAVVVQHEYGIYGGHDGSYVLDLVRRLRMPVLTTLHTVLREPSPGQRAVIADLARHSDRLVVMSQTAQDMLHDIYQTPREKVAYIPHGIPDVPFTDSSFFKDQFGLESNTVLLTFGLLSPGKGIETAIRALPAILQKHPEVVYVIVGATHPHVLKHEGNAYRYGLERLVAKLGLSKNVIFHNRFVSREELLRYISAADVYVVPYPNVAQITSGTLAYALGAGKAIVSTPFWHATEMLAQGRGRHFAFNDSAALAREVNDLLDNPVELQAMRKRAYLHGRPMVWKEVARSYLQLAAQAALQRRSHPRPVPRLSRQELDTTTLPDLSLTHLRRLTDDTGIFQHAIYAIPNRLHGYCTDDNARALVAALLHYDLERDPTVLPLVDVYLSFLHHAFNPQTRRFHNFMGYDRRWLEEAGSEDTHGRAIWALGLTATLAPTEAVFSFATRLFHSALEVMPNLNAPRAWAFALVGIHAYLERLGGDTQARRVRAALAERLQQRFTDHAGADWPWCEDVVTYDNAKLPHALILSGQWIPDPRMTEMGLRALEWLVDLQLQSDGNVSLIGNQGWIDRRGKRARFDQQPIEAMALIEACAEAHRCTHDVVWLERARAFLGWFLGSNDTQAVLYDYHTAGCRDGLHADGPNLNQGAESTLAWLVSLLTVMGLNRRQSLLESDSPSAGVDSPRAMTPSPLGPDQTRPSARPAPPATPPGIPQPT